MAIELAKETDDGGHFLAGRAPAYGASIGSIVTIEPPSAPPTLADAGCAIGALAAPRPWLAVRVNGAQRTIRAKATTNGVDQLVDVERLEDHRHAHRDEGLLQRFD